LLTIHGLPNSTVTDQMMAKLVSVAKAARILGISRARMQQLIRNGDLETFEGQVEVDKLRSKFPRLAFNESPDLERANIIKDSAYGERIQNLVQPPTDVLQAKIRRLSVDLNVERTRARDYEDIINGLLEKLGDMQHYSDESQRRIINDIHMWLLARFDSTRD
jgi:CDP-4-dehydro-6-deoxyglucose reductase